ncbi:MAG: hypothetical protein ACKOCD_07290 [Nitrospiraceae bacterium]
MSVRRKIGSRRPGTDRLAGAARVMVGMLLLATPPVAFGEGLRLTLAEKVFQAESIVEVRLPLDQPVPKHQPAKTHDPKSQAFPRSLFVQAMKGATVERVLKPLPGGTQPPLPKQIYVFAIQSPCWWNAHQRGSLRTLVFLKHDAKGRYEDSGGVEHEQGLYSDLNPDYAQLVKAIQEVTTWKQDDSGPGDRAVQEKILTASHDPYQLYLTVQFLNRYAPAVLDEVWGAKGTSSRTQYDKMVTEPTVQTVCRLEQP